MAARFSNKMEPMYQMKMDPYLYVSMLMDSFEDGEDSEDSSVVIAVDDDIAHLAISSAKQAATNRNEDPLANWIKPKLDICPICCLAYPVNMKSSLCNSCGQKLPCWGCLINQAWVEGKGALFAKDRELWLKICQGLKCPYCRNSPYCEAKYSDKEQKEKLKLEMKLAESGGRHESMFHVGGYYERGELGLEKNASEAFKWYERAAEAGSGKACVIVGRSYVWGDEEDQEKGFQLLERAAELGEVTAFYLIGRDKMSFRRVEEAVLAYRKAAMCGVTMGECLRALMNFYQVGVLTKDEYAFTLREHQKAIHATASGERMAAKRLFPGQVWPSF